MNKGLLQIAEGFAMVAEGYRKMVSEGMEIPKDAQTEDKPEKTSTSEKKISITEVREEVSVVEVVQAMYWQNSVRVNMFLSANVSSSLNKAVSSSVFLFRSDKYPEVRILVKICFRKSSTALFRISSMAFSIASQTTISRSPFSRRDWTTDGE